MCDMGSRERRVFLRMRNIRSPSKINALATAPAVAPPMVPRLFWPSTTGDGENEAGAAVWPFAEAAEEEWFEIVLDDVCEGESVFADGVDEEEEDTVAALEGRKSAACFGFEDRNPAVRSPEGQPLLLQAFTLQQPMKAGCVAAHVYHRLPLGHS